MVDMTRHAYSSPTEGGASACPMAPRLNSSFQRVAVCLVGFVRTFGQREVYSSISRRLRPAGSAVDFYGVVSLGDGEEQDTAKGQWGAVSREAIRPALSLLQPVAWEDAFQMRAGMPPCGLQCMRQYERLERCGELLRRSEDACRERYDWVIKARPDIAFDHGPPGEMPRRLDTIYKDRAAGDVVAYLPRLHFDNLTRALASGITDAAPNCSSLHHSVKCDANGTGPGCKCNWMMSLSAAKQQLRVKYHSNTPRVVRTREAGRLISTVRDAMKSLHNRGQADPRVAAWMANATAMSRGPIRDASARRDAAAMSRRQADAPWVAGRPGRNHSAPRDRPYTATGWQGLASNGRNHSRQRDAETAAASKSHNTELRDRDSVARLQPHSHTRGQLTVGKDGQVVSVEDGSVVVGEE
jgi:hypothetical protein